MAKLQTLLNYRTILRDTGNRFVPYNMRGDVVMRINEMNIPFLRERLDHLRAAGVRSVRLSLHHYKRQSQRLTTMNFFKNAESLIAHIQDVKRHPLLKKERADPKSLLNRFLSIRRFPNITSIRREEKKQLRKGVPKSHATITTNPVEKVFIELTKNCNLNCQMCGHSDYLNKPEFNMAPELFSRIAKELFADAKFVDLRGFGESMLYPYWDKIFPIIKRYDCDFGMITNLALKNDSLYKKMVEHDMWFQASWDGGTQKTFEKIRRNSRWPVVLHNLKLIARYRKEIESKTRIEFIITVQGDNVRELVKIVALGIRYGIDGFVFSPIVSPNPHDPNCLWAHKKELRQYLPKAIALAEKHKKNIQIISSFYGAKGVDRYMKLEKMTHCNRPWSWIYIDYAGNVGPCNHMMDANFTLGNIRHNTDMLQLRNNYSFQLLRNLIDTNNRLNFCDFCYKRRYDN